ncbi:MAG: ACP S-malonyltransferase [Candidatus Omnitrophota bacterium]
MSKSAFLFPGQGAQYVGMGRDFYEQSGEFRHAIDAADRFCGNGLKEAMFNGPEDKLQQTDYAQPAIFAMSYGALQVLNKKHPGLKPDFVAGLSLGEYSALAASGALSFEDTLRLLQKRAAFMQEAAQLKKGAMAAVIGIEVAVIKNICGVCRAEVANFNAPDQTVITGEASAVNAACLKLTEAGAKRVIPLSVSGAFHSSLMKPAADKFVTALEQAPLKNAAVPIVGNVDARPCVTAQEVREELARQIVSSVQWVKTIEFLVSRGVDRFIEIGPGKILKGLVRRINKDLDVENLEKMSDLK